MHKNLIMAGLCAALLASTSAMANTAKPAELYKTVQASTPYGQATLRKIGFRVYDATLWTDARPWTPNSTYALSLTYHMNFSPNELAQRSIKEMQRTIKSSAQEQTQQYETLVKLFPPVKPDDRITTLYQPAGRIQLYYNGSYRGEITDPAFAKAFMGIWLSPKTSEPETRAELINSNEGAKP